MVSFSHYYTSSFTTKQMKTSHRPQNALLRDHNPVHLACPHLKHESLVHYETVHLLIALHLPSEMEMQFIPFNN